MNVVEKRSSALNPGLFLCLWATWFSEIMCGVFVIRGTRLIFASEPHSRFISPWKEVNGDVRIQAFGRMRGSLPNYTFLCLCSKRSPPACGKVQFAGHEYMMRAGWRADLALTLPSPSLCHAHASLCLCCLAERLSSSRLSPPLRLCNLRRDGGASALAHWAPSVLCRMCGC